MESLKILGKTFLERNASISIAEDMLYQAY
jgi:hypothetical protein